MPVVKAYYLLRRDLRMSGGKMAVEGGHGADLVHLNSGRCPLYAEWLSGEGNDRRKIVGRVADAADLERWAAKLDRAGLAYERICDNGHTEFGGQKTVTGIVVLPVDDAAARRAGLHRLQLWKDDGAAERARRAEAVLDAVVKLVRERDTSVAFEDDCGEGTLTLRLLGSHTHMVAADDAALVDRLYEWLVLGRGLSLAVPVAGDAGEGGRA